MYSRHGWALTACAVCRRVLLSDVSGRLFRQVMWSVGELLGPLFAGFMLETLPVTPEPNCHAAPENCTWAFHNTLLVIATITALAALCLCVCARGA